MERKLEDDEMPPELEDFSEELNKIRINKKNNNDLNSSEIKVNVIENKLEEQIINKKINTVTSSNKEEEFGSFMKKGFFKKTQNKNTAINSNKVDDLTNIKSNTPGENKSNSSFHEEFKSQLKANSQSSNTDSKGLLENIVTKKDEWMNQDLLMKISQKPSLIKYFMDPRFTEVITLMQKDPQKAIAQYGHVNEFSQFIKEFSEIMAEHFGNLSKDKEKENPSPYDKETQEILNDPKIIPIIFKLQTEGKLDIEEINKDLYISSRVKKLIDKGVFRIQKESEINNLK